MGAAPAALADASVISTMSAWIEQALRPISDADPAVLSKYVLALLKKDTPLDTMRGNCIKELEDFLEDKTRGFVDALFRKVDEEIARHAKRAEEDTNAEEDELDYGEGSDSEKDDERPRGRREGPADTDARDDRPDHTGRSNDRRRDETRHGEHAREPDRRRPRSRSPPRSQYRDDGQHRDYHRGRRDSPDRRGHTYDRRDEHRDHGRRDQHMRQRADGHDDRAPPPLPPGPPPSAIPMNTKFPTPDPKDAARKIPEPMDDTVRAVFFQIPPKAIAYFERHHKSDFGVKIYDFYSQFGDVEDVRPNHKNFRATVVYADVESARRAVVFRRVLFWDKELKNVETRWARPEAEIERRREKKLAGTEEKKAEREAAAEKRKAEADEREAARVKAVEALRVKREHARRLAAIEAEKRALKEKLEAASAPKRPAESTTSTLKKGGDVAAAAAKLERDAKELRAKYEAMVAAKKRKSTEEGTPAGGGNKRGKK
jgi:RNA-binding protein 26